MSAAVGPVRDGLGRLLPFLTAVTIMTCGYLWFIQPHVSAYLRLRDDVHALSDRARVLQQAVDRGRARPPAPAPASRRTFEEWVPVEDRVPEVASVLVKAVQASAAPGRLRGLTIQTGDRVQPGATPEGGPVFRPAIPRDADSPDPRLALFPYAVSYTPIRITFESTFDVAGSFFWRLRDLPTAVELRAATLTRGLPLMRTEVLIRVFHRGEARDASLATAAGGEGEA